MKIQGLSLQTSERPSLKDGNMAHMYLYYTCRCSYPYVYWNVLLIMFITVSIYPYLYPSYSNFCPSVPLSSVAAASECCPWSSSATYTWQLGVSYRNVLHKGCIKGFLTAYNIMELWCCNTITVVNVPTTTHSVTLSWLFYNNCLCLECRCCGLYTWWWLVAEQWAAAETLNFSMTRLFY